VGTERADEHGNFQTERPVGERRLFFRVIPRVPWQIPGMDTLDATLAGLLVFGAASVAATGLFRRLRASRRRREWMRDTPFPPRWRKILRRNLPAYHRLPDGLRGALETKVKRFLADKTFEACGGLETVSDDMAVTVAGYACLLVCGRAQAAPFPGLEAILMYPDSFYSTAPTRGDGPEGVRTASGEHRVGEYDPRGALALSWREIRENIAFAGNGRNVVLHEFAHRLDGEDAVVDGVPGGMSPERRAAWRRDMGAAYARLREDGHHGVLDPYGAREPAELFAVATEAFFEDAVRFRTVHPEIHGHFVAYYGLDPATWH